MTLVKFIYPDYWVGGGWRGKGFSGHERISIVAAFNNLFGCVLVIIIFEYKFLN